MPTSGPRRCKYFFQPLDRGKPRKKNKSHRLWATWLPEIRRRLRSQYRYDRRFLVCRNVGDICNDKSPFPGAAGVFDNGRLYRNMQNENFPRNRHGTFLVTIHIYGPIKIFPYSVNWQRWIPWNLWRPLRFRYLKELLLVLSLCRYISKNNHVANHILTQTLGFIVDSMW